MTLEKEDEEEDSFLAVVEIRVDLRGRAGVDKSLFPLRLKEIEAVVVDLMLKS